jgi:hypothetical protein
VAAARELFQICFWLARTYGKATQLQRMALLSMYSLTRYCCERFLDSYSVALT